MDFTLDIGPDVCSNDCTFTSDNVCHAECAGLNGCSFYDSNVQSVCDGQTKDFTLDYPGGQLVQCCTAEPFTPQLVKAESQINATNVYRVTRIVSYRGKPVKLVVDIFR